MHQKAKYLGLKAIRLGILVTVLAIIVLAGNSMFSSVTGVTPVTADSATSPEPPKNSIDRVNINTANLQQLMDLPTIGQVIGSRIIEYREQHGPFKHTADIIIVKGISERKFRQLEDFIAVDRTESSVSPAYR